VQRVAPTVKAEILELRQGAGVERGLREGKVDAYEIDLTVGQYLLATFDQQGIDVAVDVFGPGRRLLFEVDSPYGTHGKERVHLAAEASGHYRLDVRWLAGAADGHYLARLEALRPATETDYRRATAERAFYEARGLTRRDPISWEAAAKFEQAARLFRQVDAGDRQAEALYRLGQLDFYAHRCREALDLFHGAQRLYGLAHDRQFVVLSENEIGRSEFCLGEQDRALAAYRRALRGWREQPFEIGHATTLDNLGELFAYQGKTADALRFYRDEADLLHRLGSFAKEARALVHVSWNLRMVGDWDQALATDRRALELCKGPRDPQRAAVLTEIGKVYLEEQEPRRAIPYLQQALAVQTGGADVDAVAGTLASIGMGYRRLQEFGKSLAAYEKALRIYQAAGNRQAEAVTWNNLGAAYRYMRQPQRAAECYNQSLRLARATGYRAMEAEALLGAGMVARDRGNPFAALAEGEAAIRIVEALRTEASRPDRQISYLALNVDFYDFLVEVLMQLHGMQPGRGFDVRALQFSEQKRARSLLDSLASRRASRIELVGVAPALLAERQRLSRQIAARDLELRSSAVPGAPPIADLQLQGLWERWREVEELIHKTGAAARTSSETPPPRLLAEMQRELLDDDTLLLEYSLGPSKSFLWAATRDAVASFELPSRDQLEPLLRSAYSTLSRSQQRESQDVAPSQAAAELSRILLGQVANRLGSRRLLIVADGALRYIPFAALPDPRDGVEPLALRHEIVYAPSLAVLAELRARQQSRTRPAGVLALIADPVFGGQDERARHLAVPPQGLDPLLARLPRLPYAQDEAQAIASLAGRQGVLQALGFDANRELVMSGRLRPYGIVHFATHGILRTDRPELSALALSQLDRTGRLRDGWLRAHEIADLDLPADLVVLSACKTALGKELGGEGLVGLPQGFMSAGARRVLVSLWDVGDRSTAELMAHFYRYLLVEKLPPAAALCASQRAMWREARWRAPCYWAGFVLIGDWR
jgi:CHAT domain-containing protein/tetratricopeptide (TPR) repeat protein